MADASRCDREITRTVRDTGSQPTEDARTGEPDRQCLVDLQRALDGAPWWGETLSFDGALKVERRWLIAGFDRASAI